MSTITATDKIVTSYPHDAGMGHPYTVPDSFFTPNVDADMRAAVTSFVSWCSEQSIDTRSFVANIFEYGDTDDERTKNNGGILPREFDDVVSDWINATDDAPGVDWHERYYAVSEFHSSWEFPDTAPTRVVFRSFLPYGTWNDPNGVIALMPEQNDSRRSTECTSYMHHGQHGQASRELMSSLFRVSPNEGINGVRELQARGYRVLVDTAPGGVLPPPRVIDPALDGGNSHVIARNADAAVHISSSTPFNNRAYTFRGRRISVPVNTVVILNHDENSITHSVTLEYPGNRSMGTGGTSQTIELGTLPGVYVRALVHELRRTTGTRDAVVFLVWTYSTVIHWHRVDEYSGTPVSGTSETPGTQYSATTSKHQRIVHDANV